MADLKNVVVVGLGPYTGGKVFEALAKALPSTHRVIGIDARDFAYITGLAARAAVVPGWEQHVVFPLAGLNDKNSRHRLILNTRVVAFDGHSVTLDKAVEGFEGTTIQADAIVLATASSYNYPATVDLPNIESIRKQLVETQKQVAAANDFVIVGGGPYGVELAGEIASQHTGKNITLVTSQRVLIGSKFTPKLAASLATQLQSRGVKIVYEDHVDENLTFGPIEKRTIQTRQGVELAADFVVPATGSRTNAALMEAYPDVLGSQNRFKVRPTFQLDSDKLSHVFGIGDSIDMGLTRTAAAATFQLPALVKNVVALVKGGKLSDYKPGAEAIFITVGPNGGAATLFGFFLPSWIVKYMKSRDLMKGGVHSMYRYKPVAAAA